MQPGEVSDARRVALRCLIVDDNEEFLASSARVLESQGLQVVGCASSGDDAMRLAEALRPDVALIDVRLGREDGVELARRFAAGAPSTRVVLMSTYGNEDATLELLDDSPAIGFLHKVELSAAAVTDLAG